VYNSIINRKGSESMAMPEKVIGLNPNRVYGAIMGFLNEKAINSENTRKAYEDDITQFFTFTRNKSLADLTREDLNYSYDEVLNFKLFLADKYGGSSVNRKLSTIRKLFKVLGRTFDDLKQNAFQVDNVKATVENYGVLSYEEALEMISRASKYRRGAEKSALIYLATMTSFRLTALLNIKWKDIRKENGLWTVHVIDKGQKKDVKAISDNLYNTLIDLRKPETKEDDFVFSFDPKTCSDMIRKLCDDMQIDPERNIVFHSLRKVAINWALDYTKDVATASRQANHSTPAVTYGSYAKRNNDLSTLPSVLMEQECDMSILEALTKEQLIAMIDNACYDVKMKLIMAAKKSAR
jgi:integrase